MESSDPAPPSEAEHWCYSRQAQPRHNLLSLVCQKVLVCSNLVCLFLAVKNVVNDDVLSKLNQRGAEMYFLMLTPTRTYPQRTNGLTRTRLLERQEAGNTTEQQQLRFQYRTQNILQRTYNLFYRSIICFLLLLLSYIVG